MILPDLYKGQTLLVATKHQKERVIGPPFQKAFGFQILIGDLDTDLLGTFSGEIERTLPPIEAAREKCLRVMDSMGSDFAVASEGTFGAHPSYYFVPSGTELLMFKDRKNEVEIWVQSRSTETNYAWMEVQSIHEMATFLERVKFPSHGLIMKNNREDFTSMEKGILDKESLYRLGEEYVEKFGRFFLETDMRAMYNPTRMEQIKLLTQQLIDKINTLCPHCSFPGFSISDVQRGLLCAQCFLPTQSILKTIYRCQKCYYEEEKSYPASKYLEDPMFCDYCNP